MTKIPIKFLTTWIDDELPNPQRDLPPTEAYRTPSDVPAPLRHTIRRAHLSGLSVAHLVQIYELPVEWVEQFVKPDSFENN